MLALVKVQCLGPHHFKTGLTHDRLLSPLFFLCDVNWGMGAVAVLAFTSISKAIDFLASIFLCWFDDSIE
jgi:hypothetical protein